MLRKTSLWILLAATFLGASGFRIQDAPGLVLIGSWAALGMLLFIIFVAAILLIAQTRMTPSNTARYHLDHGAAGHEQDVENVHESSSREAEHIQTTTH
jgi:hypothetical protein